MVDNVIVKCELFLTSIFEFCAHKKLWISSMAAILNFSETLKKSPAHLHIVGNVTVKFEYFLTLSFSVHKKFWSWPLAAILNFGGILKKSLAHPHVSGNVIFKSQKNLTTTFLHSQKDVTRDEILAWLKSLSPYGRGIKTICIDA